MRRIGLDEARENMRMARAELLERHEQIAHLAHHDALTDLPNRTSLGRLAETFERAKARRELRRPDGRPRSLQGGKRRVRPRRRR